MKKVEIIVTRHPGLVEYLREIGLADESTQVVAHATPEVVKGRHVCGVLPHSLSCLTASFTEVPMNLPQELRGAELSLAQVREYAWSPVTYRVEVVT
jgi:putative CRISPR-associated protein (TIGR02620 family)